MAWPDFGTFVLDRPGPGVWSPLVSLSERLDTKTPRRSSNYQRPKNNGFKTQTDLRILSWIALIFDETHVMVSMMTVFLLFKSTKRSSSN